MPKRKPIDGGLRKLFEDNIASAHWQAIEAPSCGRGIPDANYCFLGGHEGWVEFKQTKANAVQFKVEQIGWISRRVRLGGRVWLAVRRQRRACGRIPASDELILIHGSYVASVADHGLKSLHNCFALSTLGGPKKWDWKAVKAVLLTG